MKYTFGFVVALLLASVALNSYMLFCPHYKRAGQPNSIEIQMTPIFEELAPPAPVIPKKVFKDI